MNKRSIAVIVTAFIFLSTRGLTQDQTGCGTNPIQDWYAMDARTRVAWVTGTISNDITVTSGHPYDDGDWNVYLVPDDPHFLRNGANAANTNGILELETNSPADLKSAFGKRTRIRAFGEWVQDAGHSDKTEIHPLFSMRSLDRNPVTIFVGQDDTLRFVDTQNVLWQVFDLPHNLEYTAVKPGWIPPSQTRILHEQGQIARGTTRAWVSGESYSLEIVLDSWLFGDCNYSMQRVIYGDAPFYLGTVTTTLAPLLTESVSYSVSTDIQTHQKVAMITVQADLAPPPALTFLKTVWTYESSAGNVVGTAVEEKTTPPYRVQFSMPYSPALGYNQSSWRMSVVGTAFKFGEYLPPTGSDFAQPVDRTVVVEGRRYLLEPSTLSFDKETKGSGACLNAMYLTANTTKLLPSIGIGPISWVIRPMKNPDGSTITQPTDMAVTFAAPLNEVGFSASANAPPNDRRFDVIWKTLSSGEPNLSQIELRGTATTELGERVVALASLSPLCGIGPYSSLEVRDYIYRLLNYKRYAGEWEEAFRKARKADKEWMRIFARFSAGEPLSRKENGLLSKRVEEGSKLPAIRRTKPSLKVPGR